MMQIAHAKCDCCNRVKEVFGFILGDAKTELDEVFSICPDCIRKKIKGTFFKCPDCNTANSQEEWNKETRKVYGEDISEIQDCDGDANFVCPNCKQNNDKSVIR